MPSFADSTSVEDRWNIANFVNSLCERDEEGPLGIDPLTVSRRSISSFHLTPVEGKFRAIRRNENVEEAGHRYVAIGWSNHHKPRNFVNRIDDIWVKSLYNEKSVGVA